ncbi:MAG: hypothetical protein A2Y10_01310 [Planctomycetes bacterium GWF2_41_51]|nr:MAG: hypothetical protein A2Y10_01310 [Planctomycetes bacterium GWF2_41_51]HBG26734.1 hypothetical protein [Phycisphaerales bacterium]
MKNLICCWALVLLMAFSNAFGVSTWLGQKTLPDDGAAGDLFGSSVSINGQFAAIGAEQDDSAKGSVYIFKRVAGTWVKTQKLTASDGTTNNFFGRCVCISGNYLIIGADGVESYKGAAYIYYYDGTSWSLQEKIVATDRTSSDDFGCSVSMSGNFAIVGASGDDSSRGSAYIFQRDGSDWQFIQKISETNGTGSDFFSCSVGISGNLAIVGVYGDDDKTTNAGSAIVYGFNGTSWIQGTKLMASDGASGDNFGCSVAINGLYAIIGSYYDDDPQSNSGSAYIFKYNSSSYIWSQMKLTPTGVDGGDLFGSSVCINGNNAIIGSKGDGNGSSYIFSLNGSTWSQVQKLIASDGALSDAFGNSVAIDGLYSISGAYNDDDFGISSGSAYVFEYVTLGSINLLAPNGGENLIARSDYDISWGTTGTIDYVNISYSTNNGSNWTEIDTVPNNGAYTWMVADVNSNNCRLRVSDAGLTNVNDVSDNQFRIYQCRLYYDLNDDCLVDFKDFAELTSEWLMCGDPANPDCLP